MHHQIAAVLGSLFLLGLVVAAVSLRRALQRRRQRREFERWLGRVWRG